MKIALMLFPFGIVGLAQGAMSLAWVYDESTGDTVVTYSGTWDVYTSGANAAAQSSIVNSNFFAILDADYSFSTSDRFNDTFSWLGVPVTSSTGARFGFDNQFAIYAPTGYTQGTPILGTATFAGADLAALGLFDGESGSYTSLSGNNSVSYTAEAVTVIPEPISALLGSLGLLTLLLRRR